MASSSSEAGAHYAIRGGNPGRERLRVLARMLQPTTGALFDRLRIGEGHICLDVGCGGGDVTVELARRVGSSGRVTGTDIDEAKLDLARSEAAAQGLHHVTYRKADVRGDALDSAYLDETYLDGTSLDGTDLDGTDLDGTYDVVYARFLLSHLPDPAAAVAALHRHVRPGGLVVLEDVDASATFAWPPSAALDRYRELLALVMRRRGGDPDIGPRLPSFLLDAGFDEVDVHVVQPAALSGETKTIHALTMENIADAAIADGLATRDECDTIVRELHAFAADPRTLTSLPRIVQTWGRRGV